MDLRTLGATREELAKWNGLPSDGHCELKRTVVNVSLGENVRVRASIVNSEVRT